MRRRITLREVDALPPGGVLWDTEVQGLGVRPAVARLAQELELTGSVGNSTGGVSIHVEGRAMDVMRFRQALAARLPLGTRVESLSEETVAPVGAAEFRIEASTSDGRLAARVPADIAVCPKCLAEVKDTNNRRHSYPFTTCTECGPRYSLIESMPYDRAATGMKGFTPCAQCSREYARPADRRFHSQTNGCPACGPGLWLRQSDGHGLANAAQAIAGPGAQPPAP